MRFPELNHRKKGFTLTELLIVVAIIGILLAVAVPNVLAYYKELKITELDDSARTIFVAAQNRLTALINAGEDLSGVGKKIVYPAGATGKPDLKYIQNDKSDSTVMASLHNILPGGSVDSQLQDNNFIIEFNPQSGAVYAVWYWEKYAFNYKNDGSNITDKTQRVKDGRMVGYYGGENIDRLEAGQMPFPTVKLINAEEQRMEIGVPSGSLTDADIRVDVFVNGEPILRDANIWQTHSATVVLDTLNSAGYYSGDTGAGSSGWVFGDKFENLKNADTSAALVTNPGDDITISVKLYYNGTLANGTTPLPQTVTVSGNSLFESIEENPTASGTYIAHIAYGRHLQNLDKDTSRVSDFVTGAIQTRNIDFNDTTSVTDVYSWRDTYGTRSFDPIENSVLTTFDGNDKIIRNLNASSSAGDAGLFGTVTASDSLATIRNVTLINAKATGNNAGSLVGSVSRSLNVLNCGTYLIEDTDNRIKYDNTPGAERTTFSNYITGTSGDAGGLIGAVDVTGTGTVAITNSFASTVVNGQNAGGLIGSSQGTLKIEKSYSAGYVEDIDYAGGLVGCATTGNIEVINSYAAGIIDLNVGDAGGLVGYYEAGDVTVSATSSYAAVRYVTGTSTPTVYGTFNGDSDTTGTQYVKQSGVSYATDSGKADSTAEIAKTFESSTDWTAPSDTPNGNAHPYNLIKETLDVADPYPYPMLNNMPHYGDWLENKANGSLLNWEQYPAVAGVPQYGFWGLMGSGGGVEPINTLKRGDPNDDNLDYAIADGYGVLVPQDATGNSTAPDVTIETSTGSTKVDFSDTSLRKEGVYEDDGVTYDLYVISYTASTAAPADYYTAVTVDGSTFWYNPDFACEVLERKEGADAPDEPVDKNDAEGDPTGVATSTTAGVVIRTARQLANLPVYTGATLDENKPAQLRAYTQLLDIDYGEYEGIKDKIKDTPQSPAALTKTTGSGSYDGKNFVIKNLFIKGTDKVGLFGELNLADGTTGVRNVFLVDVTVTGTGDNVGALVGSAGGSTVIDHCGVYVSPEKYTTCTVTGQQTVGGLIGMVGSSTTVQNSFAAVQVSGTTYVGGFAGQINGNRELANCYSGGYTQDGQYKADTANVTATDPDGTAGGFAGRMVNYNNKDNKPTNLALSGVLYSTCSVKGNTVGLLIGRFDSWTGAVPADVTYKDFKDLFSTTTGLTLYATGVAFNSAGDSMTSGLNDEPYLTTGNAIPRGTLDDAHTHNYDEKLKTAAYPYKVADGQTEHHGDWVTFPMLAYIEKYQKGTDAPTYGAYAASVNADGKVEVALNKLKSQDALADGEYLVEDYYRIISLQKLTRLEFTLDGTPGNLVLDEDTFDPGGIIELDGQEYYVYKFEAAGWDSATNYYHTLVNGNYTFLFNSHFGLEAFDVTAKPGTDKDKILEKPEAAGKKGNAVVEVEYKDETGAKTDIPTGVVIRSARQLANIQEYTNHIEPTINSAAQGWVYDQLLDVNFEKYTGSVAGGKVAPGLNPATLTTGAYDGHGHLIVNLYIGPGAAKTGSTGHEPAGLFGTVGTGGEVRHVRLVNIQLDLKDKDGKDSDAIGGLIGRLDGGTVDDCGIYVDKAKAEASFDTLEKLYNSKIVRGSGESGVGGLIGQVRGGNVTSSFAAVKVEGTAATNSSTSGNLTNPAGGFVGQINGGTFGNCYVGGYVDANSHTYVADTANVTGNNRVGGFVGNIAVSGIPFNGINYSTASVYGPDADQLGLFAGAGVPTGTGAENYALAKAFTDELDPATGVPTGNKVVTAARDESDYLVSPEIQTTPLDDTHTHKYNTKADEYPYQTKLPTHYGDWIGLTQGSYYDTTQASGAVAQTTGWYSQGGALSATGFNTLAPGTTPTGRLYAIDDGYAFLSVDDLGDEVAMGIDGVSYTLKQRTALVTIGSKTYWVYDVPSQAMNAMTKHYYANVSVNGQYFTANFALAAEIFDGKTEETELDTVKEKTGLMTLNKTEESNGSTKVTMDPLDSSYKGGLIRSARQLANLGVLTNSKETAGETAKALTYNQVLDIDFDEYKDKGKNADGSSKLPSIGAAGSTYNHQPITLEGITGVHASYNGHGCDIVGLAPGFAVLEGENIAASGLFSRAKNADLSNIRLVNSTFTADTGVTGGTGGGTTTPGGGVTPGGSTGNGTSHVLESSSIPSSNTSYSDSYFSAKGFRISSGGDRTWNENTDDEYSVNAGGSNNPRIQFSDKATASGNNIQFKVTSKYSVVKIWWVNGAADRKIVILNASGNEIYSSGTSSTSSTSLFSTYELFNSGTYYIGNAASGSNYIFKVEVIEYDDVKVFDPGAMSLATTSPTVWDDGFTVYHASNSVIGTSAKSWSDGSQLSTRLHLNGKLDASHAVAFTTTGAARVEVWWVAGGANRHVTIKKDNADTGTEIATSYTDAPTSTTSDSPYLSTFSLTDAGTYYLAGGEGNCYIYRIVVIENDPISGGSTGGTTGGSTGSSTSVSSNKIRVGALAGVLDNANVENCGVYVESESGATYADYDDAYNKFKVENTVAGADNDLVGGLAGNVTGSTVTNSFAAVKVTGVRIVGGFAGRLAAGTVIENCYVGGHTYQGTFFGVPAAPGVEGEGIVNVQATAKPASNVSVAVGGFAGEIPLNDKTVTFKGVNYSTASFGVQSVYMGTTSTNATSEASHLNADLTFDDYTTEMGQFIGKVREGAELQRESGANLYAMGEAFVNGEYVGLTATAEGNGYEKHENDDGYDFKTSGDKDVPYINHKSGDYLNSTALVANVTTTSVQKYDTNLGDNYPYAQAQYIHHGDWTSRYNLIYYEVYSKDDPDITDTSNLKVIPDVCGDNYIGFYAVLRNEDNSEGATINTLSLTGHVIDSGYMVLSDAKVDTMKFSINSTYGGKLATENSVLRQVAGDDPVEFTGTEKDGSGGTVPVTEKYYVYPVPFATINIAPSDTYYQHVTINGQPYMLNQHFACEAINVGLVGTDGKMDYKTVRAKPGLRYNEYVRNNQNEITRTTVNTLTETDQVIIIRSPWNLAGMARYTRDGNESEHRKDARTWTYLQTMDIDYTKYKEGQIYDGNTTNRSEPVRTKWFAGTNFPYGQAPAQLLNGGHFNGNGHIIANLYLSSDSTKKAYVGLFGLISGEGTVVENIYMENLYVNAWGGPDDGIYVGGIAGEIAKGATLRNVSVHNLEMDFHKVPTWDKDNSTYKEGGTTKFKAVGGIVGHLTDGSVSNVYVNSLSIDFGGNTYSYSWTSEKAKDKEGKEKDDYYINGQFANSSSGIKYGSSVHKGQASMSVGGAIGEIDASASGADVSVTDVYVVNPLIKANKGTDNSVGGIVGKAVGKAKIANSGVYHAATTDSSGTVLTTAAAEYEGGGVRATAGTTDDHTDHVGGFAGEVGSGVTVTNSFAAVKVIGKQDVGGFAGHIADATIENCFAGGHTVNGQYETGPGKANVTANNSSNAYAGGFVGSVASTGNLRFAGTVYSTASVEGTIGRGAFLGNSTGADAMESVLGASSAPTLYATGISADAGEDLWDEATEYGLLTGLDVPTGNANADNRYDQTLPGSYPFKNETKVNLDGDPTTPAVAAHFGDWAKAEMVSAIYYELEEGGTYHFYSLRGEIATGKFGTKPIDSLCKEHDGKAITAWGYGYLVPDGVTVTDKSGAEIGTTPTGDLQAALEKKFGVGVKIVAGSTTAMLEPDTWTFTDTVTNDSISFYVNTAYAAAIEKAEKDTSTSTGLADSTLGTEGNPYQIRTAQQLDNMDGTDTSNPNENYFEETHDVSGKGKTYSGINYFGGHFDGQSYRILDLTIATGGLITEVYGDVVLENIVLYVPANNGSITTTSGNAGGLVAATKGTSLTIRNCAVAGYTITAGTGGNAGGLVGSHEAGTLTIEKSEATTTLSGASVGGLVGAVGAGAGDVTITDSYAGGKITSATSSAGGVIGSQNTGSTAKITYKNVYSYVDMTSVNENNQKYGIGPQVNILSKDNVGFWGGGVENVNTDDHDLRKALLSLVDWSDDPDKETASDQTYIPGTTIDGLTDRQSLVTTDPNYDVFPYEAYVIGSDGDNVHYGDWPVASDYAATFYWEKEKVEKSDGTTTEEYHFYAYGAEYMEDGAVLGSELIDTLCYSHHTKERASIVAYGYGYLYPTRDRSGNSTGDFSMDTSGLPSGVTRDFVDVSADLEEMKTAMFEAFGLSDRAGDYKVQVLKEVGTAYKRDEKWTLKNSNTTSGFYQAFRKNGLAMKVNPAFGAGIYNSNFEYGKSEDKDLDFTTPAQVRTVEQFKNILRNNDQTNLDYVAMTHDVDFGNEADYDPYTLKGTGSSAVAGQLRVKLFNGNGYRIIDIKIKNNNSDGASLFGSTKENAIFKNMVIYSPDNTGVIEATNGNAAGLLAKANKRVIIENCVISGYTIKGKGAIGGFVGEATGDNVNRIADSQAYVDLVGITNNTCVGGLAGIFRGNGTIAKGERKDNSETESEAGIFDCYTGGTVKFEGVTPGTQAKVGGLYGKSSNRVTVKDSYTYMNLTDTSLSGADLYPIGDNKSATATITDCSYYEECFTGTTTQATKATVSDLAVKAAENAAEYSWWPEDPSTATTGYHGWIGNQMGGFPFRAVASYTEDGVTHYVHYGQWPYDAQVMGIAYWELYSNNTVGLQIVGVDKDGNKLNSGSVIDTLHRPGPTGAIAPSNEIVSTGYVAFSTIYNMSISMDGRAGTVLTDADKVALIAQALDVQLTGVCTHVSVVTTPEGTGAGTTESVTVTVNGTNVSLYYSSGFGGVSYEATFGTGTTPFEIRTVAQLDNIPEGSASCFKQTHDLYGETYTNNGSATGDPKYTGAVDFAGNYDGQGYRILELKMEAKDLGGGTGLGLFNSTKGAASTTVTIENVILYSPKGTATIKATIAANTDSNMPGVGGIVGHIGASGNSTVTKIQNCVVAGYIITASKNDPGSADTFNVGVGGIAGFTYYGFNIQNCEAVTTLNHECKGGGVGGILGAFHSSGISVMEITSSYAGGSIKTEDEDVHSGGIFGYDANSGSNKLDVDNCYTYVNLSGVEIPTSGTANCYTIGDAKHMQTGKTNYYLEGSSRYPAISDVFTEEKNMNGTAKSATELAADNAGTLFPTAAAGDFGTATGNTYVPDSTGDAGLSPSTTDYPFPAVVSYDDGTGAKKYYHYGDPPTT